MTEVFTGLSGDGSAVLAAPRFVPRLGIELTTVPGGVAVTSGGNPRRVMKAGWVSPSRVGSATGWPTTLFCEAAWWINFERQQMTYGDPGTLCDRVRYHFEPGVVASLYVDDSVPTVTFPLAPWDRNPAVWDRNAGADLNGGYGESVAWSYTVPVGRKLYLTVARVSILRTAVASATVYGAFSHLTLTSGVHVARAKIHLGALGDRQLDEAQGAQVILPGQTIIATVGNYDTGGTVSVLASASGLLFDS